MVGLNHLCSAANTLVSKVRLNRNTYSIFVFLASFAHLYIVHFCRGGTDVSSTADFYPTVKAPLKGYFRI